MLSGLPEIDLLDWRANTEYSGYRASEPVVKVSSGKRRRVGNFRAPPV